MNAAVRKQMYQALPRGCYIDYSSIAGQGLFSRLPLAVGAELGMSHLIIGEEIIRTPLGGFINHSDTPNCEKYQIGDRYYIKTIKPIRPQQELTLSYTFYSIG
tara:strand:+ start:1203 stop:1511 length:309 start_codon:yes stop_codon:yes gene_type:complete